MKRTKRAMRQEARRRVHRAVAIIVSGHASMGAEYLHDDDPEMAPLLVEAAEDLAAKLMRASLRKGAR